MSHHRYTTVDELRNSTRFPRESGTDAAVVIPAHGQEMLVDVHDESLGGLGLIVQGVELFEVGSEIDVVYLGEYFRARVCHIEPCDDGTCVVGVAREIAFASAEKHLSHE